MAKVELNKSLESASNSELLSSIRKLKNNENQTVADIVMHLVEIDSRGIYRDAGYSSLYSYCRECLKYSEGATFRRTKAARAIKDNPEIYELLASGKLSLCAVAELAKVIEPENKQVLLESSIGKSRAEVQMIAARYSEVQPSKAEGIRAKKVAVANPLPLPLLTTSQSFENDTQSETNEETRFSVTLEVDQEFMDLLNEAKCIVGPVSMAKIFKKTLSEFVAKKKKEPRQMVSKVKVTERKDVSTPLRSEPNKQLNNLNKKASRYIPVSTRFKVAVRDQRQCCYQSPEGHRCSETQRLQFDHIIPYALGGGNEESNLRLLCPAHNMLMAERVFGRVKIESYLHRGGIILKD